MSSVPWKKTTETVVEHPFKKGCLTNTHDGKEHYVSKNIEIHSPKVKDSEKSSFECEKVFEIP